MKWIKQLCPYLLIGQFIFSFCWYSIYVVFLWKKNYCRFSISSDTSCLIKNVNFFCCLLFGKLNGLQSENVKSDHHFLPDFKICIWLKWMNTPVTIMCSFKIFSPQHCDFDKKKFIIFFFKKILAMSSSYKNEFNFHITVKIHNIKYNTYIY